MQPVDGLCRHRKPMKYRTLPGTDLRISVVGFGCWAIGGEYWGDDVEDDQSIRAIQTALDLGINWFDTAPLYGRGHADEILVRALGARRNDVLIATKVGVRVRGSSGHAESDLSPAHLRADLEASLRRLDVETIDLLQVHWPCERHTPLEATFSTLARLKDEGKVRHIGVCNYDAVSLIDIAQWAPVVSLQTPYSLLRREMEGELLSTVSTLGLGVLAYEPLCRGLLTAKFTERPRFPDTDQRAWDDRFQGPAFWHGQRLAQSLAQVGQRIGIPTAAVAIGWVCAQPGVTAAIVNAKRPTQMIENASASEVLDHRKLWSVVGRIAALHGGSPRF